MHRDPNASPTSEATEHRFRFRGDERRRALARAIRQALGLHHGYEVAS